MTMTADSTRTRRLYRVDSNSTPDVKAAVDELTENLTDLGYWIGDAQQDERVLLAEWDGQCSVTGRKWDERYKKPVAPWDGSSDTVVRDADAASDELAMLMVSAFVTATPNAIQQNAAQAERAGKVGTLLKYEIRQRMRPNLWREINFFANWGVHYGHSIMRTGWKREFVTGKGTISAEELAAWALQSAHPDQTGQPPSPQIVENVAEEINAALADKERWSQVIALIQAKFPLLTDKRARKIAKQLADDGGEVEFRLPIEKPGCPFVKAYCPGIDFFRPWKNDEVNRSPFRAVVERYSEPEVWAKINTDGWDEDACEKLIAMGPQKAVTAGAVDQTGVPYSVGRPLFDASVTKVNSRRNQEMHSYYEVIHMWVECVDEDHFPALYEIIFHPALGNGKDREPMYFINRLVDDYADGQFTEFRREYKSRSPWESRGIPRILTHPQLERKYMRDGRINRNEMATNPPIRTTRRNAAGKPERLGMRPGATMMEERGQESGFVAPPQFDEGSVGEEEMIMRDNANLCGLFHKDVLPAKTTMHQQYLVWNFLESCRDILIKVLQFDQQYMEPINVSRVIGNGDLPFTATREEIEGQFDVQLTMDVRMSNVEYVQAIWQVMMEGINADREGAVDTTTAIRWLYQSVDYTLADSCIKDPQAVAQDEADDERREVGNAALGIATTPKKAGNPQARLDALHNEVQTNPTVAQAYATNPRTQEIIQARANTWVQALQQRQNATTGATGYKPPEFLNNGPKANFAPQQS